MAESNSTEEISGGNQQFSQICCIVCKRSRCYKKYRRHLKTHVTNGELNAEDVSKIMFKCHQTRCDIKVFSQGKTQRGYVCHYQTESKKECGHIVIIAPATIRINTVFGFNIPFQLTIATDKQTNNNCGLVIYIISIV